LPDATGLELIAGELRDAPEGGDRVLDTVYFRKRGTILVTPDGVRPALEHVHAKGFTFLVSVHGVDYYPEEPRLGVIYELIDMEKVDRIAIKTRVDTSCPEVPSIVDLHAGADHQEREIYDMFGVVFTGHPDLRRILMPEDYEGHPQRRDFPMGGEPVIFTYNEHQVPGWLEGQ
jgi:NADH-quinone oxidoreductase subunit C